MSDGRFTTERTLGPKNTNWAGDNVGYFGLHTWVSRRLGRPETCEDCGTTEDLQWANISKEYKRDVSDWKALCRVCHRKFDGITKLTRAEAAIIRARNIAGESQRKLAKEFGVSQTLIKNISRGITKYYV